MASRFNVHAVRAGHVTLNGLVSVPSGQVRFLAENANSVIDLSKLTRFSGTDVTFDVVDGGSILRAP